MSAHSGHRKAGKLKNVPLERLERGRHQPRRTIDGQGLARLAESIQCEGVIQPIFARKTGRGRFEIVAGERRWHAAKMAGLTSIPTVVGKVSDETALAIALIENLHREDLNVIDQATAMQRLVEEFGMTHQAIADTIGRSRAAVSNLIRLLDLPGPVRSMVADGKLEMGHARALLALPPEKRQTAAAHAAAKRLSVRDVEAMVKRACASASAPARSRGGAVKPRLAASDLTPRRPPKAASHIDHVSIRRDHEGRCHVSFSFADAAELKRAIDELRRRAARLVAARASGGPS